MRRNGHLKLTQQRSPSALFAFGAILIFPLLLSGCAQFNQLMGTPAESTEAAQSAPAQDQGPASQATATAPKTNQEQPAHKPSSTLSHPTQPATLVQPGTPDSKQAHDKAVAEKDQSKKDKKASVASDKKSAKKSSKPEAKPQPEDAFLPPVPLPSKPAAIGGSGG